MKLHSWVPEVPFSHAMSSATACCAESLRDSVFALYDIDGERLEESRAILEAMREARAATAKSNAISALKIAKTLFVVPPS